MCDSSLAPFFPFDFKMSKLFFGISLSEIFISQYNDSEITDNSDKINGA